MAEEFSHTVLHQHSKRKNDNLSNNLNLINKHFKQSQRHHQQQHQFSVIKKSKLRYVSVPSLFFFILILYQ